MVYNKHINNKRLKSSQSDETLLWHYSHGHVNKKHMKELQQTNLLDSFGDIAIRSCESSLNRNMTKSPFNKKGERVKDLLKLIHSDVCGPISQSARAGYRYFITNDLSRYDCVYLMRHKNEVFDEFKEYENEVENQLDKRIKTLRTDRGGEYLSNELNT